MSSAAPGILRRDARPAEHSGSQERWSLARIIKTAARRIGIDPELVSGHSLRAGHVSEADRRGIAHSAVMATTRHKSISMLNVYTRPRSLFEQASGRYFDS